MHWTNNVDMEFSGNLMIVKLNVEPTTWIITISNTNTNRNLMWLHEARHLLTVERPKPPSRNSRRSYGYQNVFNTQNLLCMWSRKSEFWVNYNIFMSNLLDLFVDLLSICLTHVSMLAYYIIFSLWGKKIKKSSRKILMEMMEKVIQKNSIHKTSNTAS